MDNDKRRSFSAPALQVWCEEWVHPGNANVSLVNAISAKNLNALVVEVTHEQMPTSICGQIRGVNSWVTRHHPFTAIFSNVISTQRSSVVCGDNELFVSVLYEANIHDEHCISVGYASTRWWSRGYDTAVQPSYLTAISGKV